MSIVLEKTNYFDNLPEEVKKALEEEVLTREFKEFKELRDHIIDLMPRFKYNYEIIFFPKIQEIEIGDSLPLTLKEWPLYSPYTFTDDKYTIFHEVVAKAKVVESVQQQRERTEEEEYKYNFMMGL